MSVININKTKAKYFENRQHQNKNQKVSESMSPWYCQTSPWFCRALSTPTKCSKYLRMRPIVAWNSSNIKKKSDAFCIIIELNLQKSFNSRTFIRRLIATSTLFEIRDSVLRFLGYQVWQTLTKWTKKACFVHFWWKKFEFWKFYQKF